MCYFFRGYHKKWVQILKFDTVLFSVIHPVGKDEKTHVWLDFFCWVFECMQTTVNSAGIYKNGRE